jgi:transposase
MLLYAPTYSTRFLGPGLVPPWGSACPGFQGSTDGPMFEDFIEQLLQHCGKWPAPKSVLVMDNASFHHTEKIKDMCLNVSVNLAYLPPYSPDLNPIEEFFAELKAYIKQNWGVYEDDPSQGFDNFLEVC